MKKVVCVYDSKVESYGTPMFFSTRGEAVRSLVDEVNREGSMIAKYPADFTMMEIGEYDELKGVIKMNDAPINYGVAIEYVNKKEEPKKNIKLS